MLQQWASSHRLGYSGMLKIEDVSTLNHPKQWMWLSRLTLWLWSFLYHSGDRDNCLQFFTWHKVFFSMFTVWQYFFLWYSCFLAENWSSAPYLQYRVSVYTLFFQMENQEIQFMLLCTKPSKYKHKFFFFQKVGCPGADLSASRAQQVLSVQSIYRPSKPQYSNGALLLILLQWPFIVCRKPFRGANSSLTRAHWQ